MQVGDLVRENPDGIHFALAFSGDVGCYTLGIIIDVEDGIATVSWFEHPIFGEHESYNTFDGLIFFNKNT